MSTSAVIALLIIAAALAIVVMSYVRSQRRLRLRSRFGPEYDRVVAEEGSAGRAESRLEERRKRVERFVLRPLSPEERERFALAWRQEQVRFVDDPRRAVATADELVTSAMKVRGYPMGEFDQRAADLSVEHSRVIEDYRKAHQIALRDQAGQATTEELRQAMQCYRTLFEHLLDQRVIEREPILH